MRVPIYGTKRAREYEVNAMAELPVTQGSVVMAPCKYCSAPAVWVGGKLICRDAWTEEHRVFETLYDLSE